MYTDSHDGGQDTGGDWDIFRFYERLKKTHNPVKLDWKQLRTAATYQDLYSRNEGGGFSEAVANIVLEIIKKKKTLKQRYQTEKRNLFKSGGSSITACADVTKQINLPT